MTTEPTNQEPGLKFRVHMFGLNQTHPPGDSAAVVTALRQRLAAQDARVAEQENILAAADDNDPRENACPECPEGEQDPPAFGSLGATAWECSAGCGWREAR